jgi:hypothetical protein
MELFINWHTWPQAEPELRALLPAPAADAVQQAVEFAVRYHGDQTRPTGAPYAEHLLEALEVLVRGCCTTWSKTPRAPSTTSATNSAPGWRRWSTG